MDVTFAKKENYFSGSYLQGDTLPSKDKDPSSPWLDLPVLPMNFAPSNPNSVLVVSNNFVHDIPNEPELDPSSKKNELEPFANTSPKTIAKNPLQVYLRRRATTIKLVHTQESKPRPSNSSISLSASNVDNDLNLPIAIWKDIRQCTQHPSPTKVFTHLYTNYFTKACWCT